MTEIWVPVGYYRANLPGLNCFFAWNFLRYVIFEVINFVYLFQRVVGFFILYRDRSLIYFKYLLSKVKKCKMLWKTFLLLTAKQIGVPDSSLCFTLSANTHKLVHKSLVSSSNAGKPGFLSLSRIRQAWSI